MAETYSQSYSGFVGVDFTNDPAYVARNRLAHCVNMWRDYDSENGAAIETFPGFRSAIGLADECGEILKVYHFKPEDKDYLVIHTTKGIFAVDIEEIASYATRQDMMSGKCMYFDVASDYSRSVGFIQNNRLWIISDKGLVYISPSENGLSCNRVYSSDGLMTVEFVIKDAFVPLGISEYLQFISNGQTFCKFELSQTGPDTYCILYYKFDSISDFITVWTTNDGWVDEAYKTVLIDAEQEIPFNLKMWLSANARYAVAENDKNYAYIPTVFYNGKPYEQRNMLMDRMIQIECGGTYVETKKEEIVGESRLEQTYVHIPLLQESESFLKIDIRVDGDSVVWNTSEEIKNGVSILKSLVFDTQTNKWKQIAIEYFCAKPISFSTIEEGKYKSAASLEYGGTSVDAILGCTKAAVYDGRVFLTGNPALPNTVFYSARNSTGANDPTYFGVYNYFNDGYGNTPNVDLLSTPSMLMVIKQDTVQDGSIYYHTGMDNDDEESKNLIPRIYPSTSGAAGLGSAGKLESHGSLSCNFLDDAVFLSRRGLEGVSKQTVNLERTIGHRSAFVDKLLSREDLSKASMTEWKGYLVICCNGHIYLADSRSMTQHADGSYQYEWFYLEGLKTHGEDQEYVYSSYSEVSGDYLINAKLMGTFVDSGATIYDNSGVRYVYKDGKKYLVEPLCYTSSDDNVKDVLAVDERLILIFNKCICVVNTDQERDELGRLGADSYSFDGCRYISGCATRLDDCGRLTVRKNTLFGLTAARFKTLAGSRCTVKTSTDGRSFDKICDVDNNRNTFEDLDFSNASYDGDADHVAVIPERSRGWVRKQYYFYSDGFCQPFGLYEMSYHYQPIGKIRY